MGIKDYPSLNKIYRFATEYSKLAELPFHFRVDSGNYETAIVFNLETGNCRWKDEKETWDDIKYPEIMIVPDVCDFNHRIILEYEEETGKRRPGAKTAKKGHGHEGDMDKQKDSRRNECYERAGFTLLRIWESNFKKSSIWKIPVTEFLIQCRRKSLNDSMKLYAKIQI